MGTLKAPAPARRANDAGAHYSPLLCLLTKISGARRVQIGTLGGYSTTLLARALPDGGRLTSLELEPATPRSPEPASIVPVGDTGHAGKARALSALTLRGNLQRDSDSLRMRMGEHMSEATKH